MRHLFGFVLVLGAVQWGGCGDLAEVCEIETETWIKDNPPPLDTDNMLDTYTLERLVVSTYQDGDLLGSLNSENGDFANLSGILLITESTVLSQVVFEGRTRFIGFPYTRTDYEGQAGVFHLEDTEESLDLHYSIFQVCERPSENCMPRLQLSYELCETVIR